MDPDTRAPDQGFPRGAALLAALALLAGCETGTPYRDPVARNDPDMRAVLFAYEASGAKPIHRLSVADARAQPTMLAAYRSVEQGKVGQPFTADVFTQVRDVTVDGAVGPLTAQLFDPAPGHRAQPIILYFHGGLGSTGSAAEDDDAARALAANAHAMVLSVNYRLAPESKFPAAYDDAIAAYRWLSGHAGELGGDSRRIAVAGVAFGGTLAIDVAIAARDAHLAPPVHVLVVDPIGSTKLLTTSAIRNTYSVPLDRDDVRWAFGQLVSSRADLRDPRINLTASADLQGLPPTTLVFSEMDPLESEAKQLAAKLQAQNVDVRQQQFAGTSYGFFGMGAAVGRAKEAEIYAVTELRGTFDKIGDPRPMSPPARPMRPTRRRR